MVALFLASVMLAQQPSPSIALLPVVNRSPEKDQLFRREIEDAITERSNSVFIENGWKVMPKSELENAIKSSGIDLNDEEQHNRASLFKIGESAKTDYVFFIVIEANGYFNSNEARTYIRVWWLDCRSKSRIHSAQAFMGQSGGVRVGSGPRTKTVQAASNAVRDAVAAGFKSLDLPFKSK